MQTFIEKFEDIARKFPNHCALEFINQNDESSYFSYKQLNDRANQIARLLINMGTKPGELIGVCFEKSFDFYATVLAIFKTKRVYVPLQPSLTAEDFAHTLTDSGVLKIITNTYFSKLFSEYKEAKYELTLLNEALLINEELDFQSTSIPSSPLDATYLIYTKGTTGTSKGILLPNFIHRPALDTIEKASLSIEDKFLLFTDIRVDAHIYDMSLPWSLGATAVATDKPLGTLLNQLPEIIFKTGISFATLPPSVLKSLISDKTSEQKKRILAEDLQSLSTVLSTLEELTLDIAIEWEYRGENTAPRKILNGYGSTEEVIGCMITRNTITNGQISIGRVSDLFAGLRLFIYEKGSYLHHGKGEFVVVGEGMGICYWKKTELTEEAFLQISDPDEPGKKVRAYKTGDSGEITPEGQVFFHGRILKNQQVKIAGNRIELDGVETKIKTHPHIADACVRKTEERIAVYLVQKAGSSPLDIKSLREFLLGQKKRGEKTNFNTAEIPSRYYALTQEQLNLAKEGLYFPTPEQSLPLNLAPPKQASYREEVLVKKIWEAKFQRGDIGTDIDFFSIGGYSMSLIAVLSLIEQKTGVAIKISQLSGEITIESLARQLLLRRLYSKSIHIIKESSDSEQHPNLFFLPPLAGMATKPYIDLYEFLTPNLESDANGYLLLSPLVSEETSDSEKALLLTLAKPNLIEIAKITGLSIQKKCQTHQLNILIGWSWGGILAYEIARQFPQNNFIVITLDSQTPERLKSLDKTAFKSRLSFIIHKIAETNGINSYLKDIGSLYDDKDSIEESLQKLKAFAQTTIAKTQDKAEKRFLNMLFTAGINTQAVLQYEENDLIPEILSFIANRFIREDVAEGKRDEWQPYSKKFSEFTIEDAHHFNLTESRSFRRMLLQHLNNFFRNFHVKQAEDLVKREFTVRKAQAEIRNALSLYVPATFAQEINVYSLLDELNNFEKRKIIFLSGPPGSGKTSLAFYLEHSFWRSYLLKDLSPISIYIPELLATNAPLRSGLELYLKEHLKLSTPQIENLLQKKLILIFDNVKQNLSETPLILDSLLGLNAHLVFLLRPDQNQSKQLAQYQKVYGTKREVLTLTLQGLTLNEQAEYIKKYLYKFSSRMQAEKITHWLIQYPELAQLTSLPVFLNFICEFLTKRETEISLFEIVQHLINSYLKREHSSNRELELIYDENTFLDLCYALFEMLSIVLYGKGIRMIHFQNNTSSLPLHLTSKPMINMENALFWNDFIRNEKSLDRLRGIILLEDLNSSLPKPYPIFVDFFASQFLGQLSMTSGFVTPRHILEKSVRISSAFFTKEDFLIALLRGYYDTHHKNWKKTLLTLITDTRFKSDRASRNAASCAITLLNAMGIPLENEDFSGTYLENALLPGLVARGSNFSHATLKNIVMPGAIIDECSMEGSNFENISPGFSVFFFGERLLHLRFNRSTLCFIGASAHSIDIYSLKQNLLTHHFDKHEGYITCLNLSYGEQFILSADTQGLVYIWNAYNGALLSKHSLHQSTIIQLLVLDKETIATLSNDHSLCLWELGTFKLIRKIQFDDRVREVQVNTAHNLFFYLMNNKFMQQNYSTLISTELISFADTKPLSFALNPSQELLAIINSKGELEEWSLSTQKRLFCLSLNCNPNFIRYIQGGTNILVYSKGEAIYSVGSKTGEIYQWFLPPNKEIVSLHFIEPENQLALIDQEGFLFLLECHTRKIRALDLPSSIDSKLSARSVNTKDSHMDQRFTSVFNLFQARGEKGSPLKDRNQEKNRETVKTRMV